MSNTKTEKTIICTTCPSGCEMKAVYTDENDFEITGNRCKRGEAYGENECFDPRRTYTGSVVIEGSERAMLPVRSASPVPQDTLREISALLKAVKAEAPVHVHDKIVENVLGTGIDIVASMTLERE